MEFSRKEYWNGLPFPSPAHEPAWLQKPFPMHPDILFVLWSHHQLQKIKPRTLDLARPTDSFSWESETEFLLRIAELLVRMVKSSKSLEKQRQLSWEREARRLWKAKAEPGDRVLPSLMRVFWSWFYSLPEASCLCAIVSGYPYNKFTLWGKEDKVIRFIFWCSESRIID